MIRRKTVSISYSLLLVLNILFLNTVFADEISIGVGFALPPYVIQETSSGIEIDILKEAFAVKGHTVKLEFLPNVRTLSFFEEGKLDGAINVKKDSLLLGYYSDDVIAFQNVAISLKDKNLSIEKIIDLKDSKFHVLAFQNASKFLGDEFAQVATENKNYLEISDQSLHAVILLKKRVDVLISDKRVFLFHLRNALKSKKLLPEEQERKVKIHTIFPPTIYSFVFKLEKIRDDFNEGLKVIRENGTYDLIMNRYQYY